MVFPSLYNGPVNYFARLVREKEISLEQYDHYNKQSYRNRCTIMGPNGKLDLIVPVKRQRGSKTLFRDIRIDYDTPWQRIHLGSLEASYASSPYYEFMMDDLDPYYRKQHHFLVELNLLLVECALHLLGVQIPVSLTGSFSGITGPGDPRQFIHPKQDPSGSDPVFNPFRYHQVFSEKHGFMPNLSILDVLFNEGPTALSVLHASLKT